MCLAGSSKIFNILDVIRVLYHLTEVSAAGLLTPADVIKTRLQVMFGPFCVTCNGQCVVVCVVVLWNNVMTVIFTSVLMITLM